MFLVFYFFALKLIKIHNPKGYQFNCTVFFFFFFEVNKVEIINRANCELNSETLNNSQTWRRAYNRWPEGGLAAAAEADAAVGEANDRGSRNCLSKLSRYREMPCFFVQILLTKFDYLVHFSLEANWLVACFDRKLRVWYLLILPLTRRLSGVK